MWTWLDFWSIHHLERKKSWVIDTRGKAATVSFLDQYNFQLFSKYSYLSLEIHIALTPYIKETVEEYERDLQLNQNVETKWLQRKKLKPMQLQPLHLRLRGNHKTEERYSTSQRPRMPVDRSCLLDMTEKIWQWTLNNMVAEIKPAPWHQLTYQCRRENSTWP